MQIVSPTGDVSAGDLAQVLHAGGSGYAWRPYLLWLLLILIWGVAKPRLSYGQSAFAAVSGTVTDQSAALVPGVQVFLHNVDTGIQRSQSTSSEGTFSITEIVPGNYSLRAMKDGFADGREDRNRVTSQSNSNARF